MNGRRIYEKKIIYIRKETVSPPVRRARNNVTLFYFSSIFFFSPVIVASERYLMPFSV